MPYLRTATLKAHGCPTKTGNNMLDMFKMALDGKRNSCLPQRFPIRNYRRDYYELEFNVPPQLDDPSTISWALIVKFITHSDAQYNCFFPGLTFFVDTDENPYVFMECPRDTHVGRCVFRCSGHTSQNESPVGQAPVRLFARLEMPSYGSWPMPPEICEIETGWEKE